MKVSILCSDPRHPVMPHLRRWAQMQAVAHKVGIFQRRAELPGGDLLFLISCAEVIDAQWRARYRNTLVIHASDLPLGRGWSPLIWQVLAGARDITVTMLEAVDTVDAGPIWRQETFRIEGHELHDELNERLFEIEVRLMDWAVEHVPGSMPVPQRDVPPTYYRLRKPEDSRLDPRRTIEDQFDLLRTCDPERYPAFFDLRGHRYKVTISKLPPPDPKP